MAAGAIAPSVRAQGTITTLAGGTGTNSGFLDNIPATEAHLDGPQGVAIDSHGNAFLTETYRIRRIDAVTGLISTVAGNGTNVPTGDGIATQIGTYGPRYLHFDPSGNLLFFDCSIRVLDLNAGTVQTLVHEDCGSSGGSLGSVSGLDVDGAGNFYVSDDYGGFIRRIDRATGKITIIAGNGQIANPSAPAGDGGPATSAPLLRPHDIAVDGAGNVYFGESSWIRRIDGSTGLISTIAGSPSAGQARISSGAMISDHQGNLYFGGVNQVEELVLPAGTIKIVAGTGNPNYAGDGIPATQANLSLVYAMAFDGAGDLWIADRGNTRLFEVSASTGLIHSVAGISPNGDGGPALGAPLIYPSAIALNTQGDIFVASAGVIRRVDHATGFISTYVSNLQNAQRMAFDHAGNLYASTSNGVLRIDSSSRAASTVAGGAIGITFDQNDNLILANTNGSTVQRVDLKTGATTTIAGTGQPNTPYSQGGIATEVPIGNIFDVAFGTDNLLYIAAPGGVLRIDSNGIISRIAGVGAGGGCGHHGTGYAGDGGTANLASLCIVTGLAFDTQGNLFVNEGSCYCFRRIAADTGLIQTVAGNGTAGTTDDSVPALSAALYASSMAFWGGDLYFVDAPSPPDSGGRVRKLSPPTPPPLPQPPQIGALVNGADLGPLSSTGGITSLFGNYLAGTNPANLQLGNDGKVTTTLGGVQLLIDGIPSPLLYVSAGQINAVVPYGAVDNVSLEIDTAGGKGSQVVPIQPCAPAIFGGFVFNPDGSINSVNNPAPKGATVTVYGTGMGQTTPQGVDGAIIQGPSFPKPVGQFSTNSNAILTYLGPAPGFVSGLMQANFQMLDSNPPGQTNVTIAATCYDPASQKNVSYSTTAGLYILSDTPVITGINPPSPQITLDTLVPVTIQGDYFNGPVTVELFYNGAPVPPFSVRPTTTTTLSFQSDFNNQPGPWSVDVVNAANQRSNRFDFTVQAPGPPTVTFISRVVFATSGAQQISINGTNFDTPLSVDVFYNGAKIATVSGAQALQTDGPGFLAVTFDFKAVAGAYGIEVVNGRGLRSNHFDFTVYPAGSVVIWGVPTIGLGGCGPGPMYTGIDPITVCGANFQKGLTVNLYRNGNLIGTLGDRKFFSGRGLSIFSLTLTINRARTDSR